MIQSPDASFCQFWLIPGQRTTVGRSRLADYAVPADHLMSSVHFQLECQSDGCRVKDLGSRNGTFVNKRQVADALLHDKDQLVAGQTLFSVEVEGDQLPTTPPASAVQVPEQSEAGVLEDETVDTSEETADILAAPEAIEPEPHLTPTPSDTETFVLPEIRRVILEEKTSDTKHKRLWVKPGQKVVFGRTEDADHTFSHSLRMSSRHFAVECDERFCRIRDLDSRNGTYVDDERVSEATLRNDQTIRAGDSEFSVRVQYAILGESAKPDDLPTYTITTLPSGVCLYRLGPTPLAIGESIRFLTSWSSLYLLCARGVLDPRFADEASFEVEYLYDWIPLSMAPRQSPLILIPRDPQVAIEFLTDRAAGNEVTCLHSHLGPEEFCDHLRLAAQGKQRLTDDPVPQEMFGDSQPQHILQILSNCSPGFGTFFFSGIEATLLESADTASWDLLSHQHFAYTLEVFGFTNKEVLKGLRQV